MIPMRNRNVPDTVGPIRPVTWCSVEPSLDTSPLRPRPPIANSAARAKTIVEWREEEADAERALAVGHELAGGVVDGGDVVDVERVAHAEHVRGDADADAERRRCRRARSDSARRRRRGGRTRPRAGARSRRS